MSGSEPVAVPYEVVMAKKWGATLGGLAVLGAFGYTAWFMRTNDGKMPWEANLKRTVSVPAGTRLELILLEGLDAGGSAVGDDVDLAVATDVTLSDALVLRRGDKAVGEVTVSRGASLVNALANKPARLSIRLKSVTLADGRTIKLKTLEGEEYQFTQANTAGQEKADIEKLWANPESQEALKRLAENVYSGKPIDTNQADLAEFAKALGLEKTAQAAAGGQAGNGLTLGKAIDAVSTGRLSTLAGLDAVMAAEVVGELADIASSVDHKLRGMFKGRTVRATIGTRVPARTAEGFEVTVWLAPGGKPVLTR